MSEFCANCRFSLVNLIEANSPVICRRYPPTVFLTVAPASLIGKAPNVQMMTEFPRMPPQGWCGDWQEKPQ